MRQSNTPAATVSTINHIVLPTHTNNHGTAFGGQIAAWCDICAAISAQRFSHGLVVTASMDELHFLAPIRRGMVAILKSQVNAAWHTSMEVGVRVDAEDPVTGTIVHCCSAYLSFVALDEQGGSRPVPALDVSGDPDAQRRQQEANERRTARLATRARRQRHAGAGDSGEG